MVVLVDVKNCVAEVGKIREELIGIKRDIESLGKWKDDSEEGEGRDDKAILVFRSEHCRRHCQRPVGGIRRIYGFQVHSPLTAFDGNKAAHPFQESEVELNRTTALLTDGDCRGSNRDANAKTPHHA